MGSGKALRKAYEKYGIENFKKEYIEVFDCQEKMYEMEANLVNEDFVKRNDTYNMKIGGFGGWDHVNDLSDKHLARCRFNALKTNSIPWSNKRKNKASKRIKNEYKNKKRVVLDIFKYSMLGKIHTEETKKSIGIKNSISQSRSRNSQYGTCWIYSLEKQQSIKIKKEELNIYISNGWIKGRKMKFD